jgi:hypothetical protein
MWMICLWPNRCWVGGAKASPDASLLGRPVRIASRRAWIVAPLPLEVPVDERHHVVLASGGVRTRGKRWIAHARVVALAQVPVLLAGQPPEWQQAIQIEVAAGLGGLVDQPRQPDRSQLRSRWEQTRQDGMVGAGVAPEVRDGTHAQRGDVGASSWPVPRSRSREQRAPGQGPGPPVPVRDRARSRRSRPDRGRTRRTPVLRPRRPPRGAAHTRRGRRRPVPRCIPVTGHRDRSSIGDMGRPTAGRGRRAAGRSACRGGGRCCGARAARRPRRGR